MRAPLPKAYGSATLHLHPTLHLGVDTQSATAGRGPTELDGRPEGHAAGRVLAQRIEVLVRRRGVFVTAQRLDVGEELVSISGQSSTHGQGSAKGEECVVARAGGTSVAGERAVGGMGRAWGVFLVRVDQVGGGDRAVLDVEGIIILKASAL